MNMHPDSNSEFDSSSSCSTASPGGDIPGCSQHPPDLLSSPVDSSQDTEISAADSCVPTVISTSPDLRCTVHPTVTTSVPSSSGRPKTKSSVPAAVNKTKPHGSKGVKKKPSKEEEERRRIRRERNKIAAAKCRNRRRELIDTLQAETDKLEDEKSTLQTEIDDLLKEKDRLEQLLDAHKPSCRLAVNDADCDDGDDDNTMLQESPSSLQLLSILEDGKPPQSNTNIEVPISQDIDCVPCNPAAAILGNSNIFLCSSTEEEALEDLKGDDLDDLVPSLEMAMTSEMSVSVPDIDLSGTFCLSDWETLYKSVANDLESLSTPVMSSSPTCSNSQTVFSFNYSEIDSLAEGFESLRGSLGVSEIKKDNLNSPTLLAL